MSMAPWVFTKVLALVLAVIASLKAVMFAQFCFSTLRLNVLTAWDNLLWSLDQPTFLSQGQDIYGLVPN